MQNSNSKVQQKPEGLIGVFDDQTAAEKAVLTSMDDLPESHLLEMSEEQNNQLPGNQAVPIITGSETATDAQGGPDSEGDPEVRSTKAAEGFAIGITAGATLGTITLLGASIILRGSGVIFLGPLASMIAGAGVGASLGGLFGSLIGSGHPAAVV
jgi:hypothetical protein